MRLLFLSSSPSWIREVRSNEHSVLAIKERKVREIRERCK